MKYLTTLCVVIAALWLHTPQSHATELTPRDFAVLTIPGGDTLPFGIAQLSICRAIIRAGGIPSGKALPALATEDVRSLTQGKVTTRSVPAHTDALAYCHDAANALEDRRMPTQARTPLTRRAYFALSQSERKRVDGAYAHGERHRFLVLKSEYDRLAVTPLFSSRAPTKPRETLPTRDRMIEGRSEELRTQVQDSQAKMEQLTTAITTVERRLIEKNRTVAGMEDLLRRIQVTQADHTALLTSIKESTDGLQRASARTIIEDDETLHALQRSTWLQTILLALLVLTAIALLVWGIYRMLRGASKKSDAIDTSAFTNPLEAIQTNIALLAAKLDLIATATTSELQRHHGTLEEMRQRLTSTATDVPFAIGYRYPFSISGEQYTATIIGHETRLVGGADLGLRMLVPVLQSPFEDRRVDLLTFPNHVALALKRRT